MFGDSLEVRDVAMPHRINTIRFQNPQFLVCHKGHGNAGTPHSAGPSCPVSVGLLTERVVIINHMTDVAEIEPASGKIRGNHEGHFLPAKTLEDRSSLRL